VALLNQRGEVQGTRDFPEGWVPLMPPRQAQAPGGGGAIPPVLPGLDPNLAARINPRSTVFTDQQTATSTCSRAWPTIPGTGW